MRAMTVVPGRPERSSVSDVGEPDPAEGPVLVKTHLVGLCGTDQEIIRHGVGSAPRGSAALVLGHEVVGEVVSAPAGCGLEVGALVAGVVRRPDPVPCPACARGEWDYCRNGGYVEHGIRGAAGFGRERWRSDPGFLVPLPGSLGDLGVLVEPMSVVCKALEVARYVSGRAYRETSRLLVTGAGPVGLLAAARGVQSGYQVTVLDQMATGLKPVLVRALGADYVHDLEAIGGDESPDVLTASQSSPFDIVLECSGAPEVTARAATTLQQGGAMVLIGICAVPATPSPVSPTLGAITNALVRSNGAVVGTVNAGLRHYTQAVDALVGCDLDWLAQLLTSRLPLASWTEALTRPSAQDVKTVIDFRA
jgi:threonine dehydrogenase-like Zn-dependent dehydrogenase